MHVVFYFYHLHRFLFIMHFFTVLLINVEYIHINCVLTGRPSIPSRPGLPGIPRGPCSPGIPGYPFKPEGPCAEIPGGPCSPESPG